MNDWEKQRLIKLMTFTGILLITTLLWYNIWKLVTGT